MSKITISFEGHINATSQLIPSLAKLLAPIPLNITIEDSAVSTPAKPRSMKKAIPVPADSPAPATVSADDAEKKAQAKRDAAKRHAEKKNAEKATATPEEEPAPSKTAKPAKSKKAAEDSDKVDMTILRKIAMRLPQTKLVSVLEELGITKLPELAEEDYGKAMEALKAAGE